MESASAFRVFAGFFGEPFVSTIKVALSILNQMPNALADRLFYITIG